MFPILSVLFIAVFLASPSVFCQETTGANLSEPKLRGLAEFQQVSIKASPIGSKLFANCRPSNFCLVQVEVSNDLATPILLDGDLAQASAGTLTFSQATEKEIIADSGCDPSAFARAWQVALSLASAGLAAPIASEIVHKRENLGVPCGGDALRLKVEEARLGKRILMPGDKTSGFLCFSVSAQTTLPDSLDVKITIPVVTKAPDQVSGQVEVHTSLLK